jgi:hypothetical protein
MASTISSGIEKVMVRSGLVGFPMAICCGNRSFCATSASTNFRYVEIVLPLTFPSISTAQVNQGFAKVAGGV